MNNRFMIVLAACAVLFIGLLFFGNNKSGDTANPSVQPTSHTQGAGKVTLIEYGDFECPGCARFHPVLKQVKAKYGDKITFQFRNFPLTSIHQNAFAAHRAAEAADKQGKFWEMHDMLYENQKSWAGAYGFTPDTASRTFEEFAAQLNLNIAQFNTDRNSSVVNDLIQADVKVAQGLKLTGTPTFFLNDTKLDDAVDTLDYFSSKIDAALAANNQQ